MTVTIAPTVTTDTTPVVDVWLVEVRREPVGVYAFWCDHCRRWHSHGAVDEGHRVSHCHKPGSPYAGGYTLHSLGKMPAALRRRFDMGRRPLEVAS